MARSPVLAAGLGAVIGFTAVKVASSRAAGERVVTITARQFAYEPAQVTLKRGEPVTLELRSQDRRHGFKAPGLALRADVEAGQAVRLRLVPESAGRFAFVCDVFCGDNHDEMDGAIVVE
jgi:cytochrome c oxidase subunit 2